MQCAQYNAEGEVSGSENCLNLAVYTPRKSRARHEKLPVMVFIHGGKEETLILQ